MTVDITIGVQHGVRELVISSALSQEEATKQIQAALAGKELLTLTDERGATYLVPTATIGFVHIDSSTQRTVGFGAI